MPSYEKIIAANRKTAMAIIEKRYGRSEVHIVDEKAHRRRRLCWWAPWRWQTKTYLYEVGISTYGTSLDRLKKNEFTKKQAQKKTLTFEEGAATPLPKPFTSRAAMKKLLEEKQAVFNYEANFSAPPPPPPVKRLRKENFQKIPPPTMFQKEKKSYSPQDSEKPLYHYLLEQDFSSEVSEKLCARALITYPRNKENFEHLAGMLASLYSYSSIKNLNEAAPGTGVFLIGPTGVGKTTTLSKLATVFALHHQKNVMLASFDVKRMMAAEQLKSYAQILKTAFYPLKDKEDLKQVLTKMPFYELCFIDTSGVSKSEKDLIEEMEEYIFFTHFETSKKVFICFPATYRYQDLLDMAQLFSAIEIDGVIITKADETRTLGPVLSAVYKLKLPLVCLTNGQQVPGDFIELSQNTLKEQLFSQWQIA